MSDTVSAAPILPRYQIRAHEGDILYCFDPSTQRLTNYKNNPVKTVDLGFAQSRILELLISRPDTILSRDEIFEFAWPDRVVGQNSLNQAIATLRELLGDEQKRLIIQTVPRHGYRLSSAFICLAIETPDIAIPETDIEPSIEPAVGPRTAQAKPMWFFWVSKAKWQRMGLYGLLALLSLSLLWRIDWGLLTQHDMVTQSRQVGYQQQLFIAANEHALSTLMDEVSPISQRLGNLVEWPTAVIFTKMHSYYSFICIDDGGASEFILVHRSKIRELTDKQLKACLK